MITKDEQRMYDVIDRHYSTLTQDNDYILKNGLMWKDFSLTTMYSALQDGWRFPSLEELEGLLEKSYREDGLRISELFNYLPYCRCDNMNSNVHFSYVEGCMKKTQRYPYSSVRLVKEVQ